MKFTILALIGLSACTSAPYNGPTSPQAALLYEPPVVAYTRVDYQPAYVVDMGSRSVGVSR